MDSREKGEALQLYLQQHVAAAQVRSVTALATKAGTRANTVSEWATKGKEPDLATLRVLASAIGRPVFELVAAYEGELGELAGLRAVATDEAIERAVDQGLASAIERLRQEGRL